MCIIAVSPAGRRQPTERELRNCFRHNPDGAGYMYARDGVVHIHKGFMDVESYLEAIRSEGFTKDDVVVYHCRISTQAGINPQMCHPFPFTRDPVKCTELDLEVPCGVTHNGVIRLDGCKDPRYSDTVHFITKYMTRIIKTASDITNPCVKEMLKILSGSKLALLAGNGALSIIGDFTDENGVLFSNITYHDFNGRWF